MSESPPLIEYPTLYTFKAMGLAGVTFVERIRGLVEGVLGKLEDGAVATRPSSGGKYVSVSFHVFLEREEQRRKVYEAFHADKSVVWYV